MTKEELIDRLQDIEWEDFEVKEARFAIPKNAWETVSAFSNTAGGWLILGVTKFGKRYEIVGVRDPEKIERDFLTTLRGEKFNKRIGVTAKKYVIDEKMVISFYIPSLPALNKPVYYNSPRNTFIRTGSGDQRATQEEIDTLYRNSSFDKKDEELTEFEANDLDHDTTQRYKTYLQNMDPGHRYNKLSTRQLLEKLRVLKDGKVTMGGLLVFGNENTIHRVNSDFRIDYLEIGGTSYSDAPTRYQYRLSEEANLFSFYFSIFERLIKKIEIPFRQRGKWSLRDENQPQMKAIREALVNLLMHSDYFSNAKPRIRVFSDRIEFFNPGSLPKDVKYIIKEDFSMPRNPIIARIFRIIKLSENIGSGFDKMINGWKAHYNTPPIISGDFDYFKIVFGFRSEKPRDTRTKNEGVNDRVSEGVSEGVNRLLQYITANPGMRVPHLVKTLNIPKATIERWISTLKKQAKIQFLGSSRSGGYHTIGNVSDRVNEGVSEGVNEGVNRLLQYITANPGMRVPHLVKTLNIPKATIERWISTLKKQAKIQFLGSAKSGGYQVISRGTKETG